MCVCVCNSEIDIFINPFFWIFCHHHQKLLWQWDIGYKLNYY